jgi:nitroreductase
MVSFEELIAKRRSIQSYKDIPVEKAKWGKMLVAAGMAPSAGNLQNWRFILVFDKEKIRKISEYCFKQTWISSAPFLVVVCSDTEQMRKYYGERGEHLYAIQNVAAATTLMMLAAEDMGLSTCWVGAFDEHSVGHMFMLPKWLRPVTILTVGYANEEKPVPQRQPVYRYTFIEGYGGSARIADINGPFGNYSLLTKKRVDQVKGFFGDIGSKIANALKGK